MKWKAIGFDLDNTLFSHEKAFKLAIEYCYHNEVVKNLKVRAVKPAPFEDWYYIFKKNCDRYWGALEQNIIDQVTYRRLRFIETMGEFHLPTDEEEADRFHRRYTQIVDTFSEPDDALLPLFQWLGHQQIKVGIVTNGTVDTQSRKIKKLGLNSEFIDEQHIIISEAVGTLKPNPKIFKVAEQRLNEKAADCLFIGDSWELDIIGATEAGWEALYLNSRKKRPSTKGRIVKECESLGEVYNWLMELERMR